MDDESYISEGGGGGGGGGGPATNIRLYLRAAKLPKSILTHQQPDVVARVSLLAPTTARGGGGGGSSPPPSPPRTVGGAAHRRYGSSQGLPSPVPPPPPSPNAGFVDDDGVSVGSVRSGGGEVGDLVDETEVVRKSSNPKWTTTFASRYEYGTQLLFFVDVFVVSGAAAAAASAANGVVVGNNANHARAGMKLIGRAAFDVKDVLGTANKIKARRLRNGGVVYAHIEYEHANTDSEQPQTTTPSSSPGRGRLLSSSAATRCSPCPGGRMLSLQLRADSLVHTHSKLKKVVAVPSSMGGRPSTYYEVSRMSSGGGWIAVYRSPPVRESVTPTWDEASIDLGSTSDLDDFRLIVSVYKIKRTECKEIGSFETTVRELIDSGTTPARITGYSRRTLAGDDAGGGKERTTFRLRRAAISDEVTGIISVVHAKVESNNDVRDRSQRFMSSFDDGSDDVGDGDGNVGASEMFDVDASRIDGARRGDGGGDGARPKFVDYVRADMVKVDFCVAVDYTSSNGDPRVPGTLHYSIPHMMNDYEEAIAAFGSTVERYSPNQEYPVWGFGAKYDGEVRHIFRCGDSKYAHGTEGVLKAYRSVFDTDFTMSGPTVISDVLRAGAGRARRFHNGPDKDLRYCVLLILTDGCVHDLPFTQGLVRSYMDDDLPLSVIVVGIGRADFTEFHQWDLAPPEIRGRFKFVEFREHQIDPDNLPRKALLNLPHEIVDYYMGRNIFP